MPSLMVSMNGGGIEPSAYLHNQLDITQYGRIIDSVRAPLIACCEPTV